MIVLKFEMIIKLLIKKHVQQFIMNCAHKIIGLASKKSIFSQKLIRLKV